MSSGTSDSDADTVSVVRKRRKARHRSDDDSTFTESRRNNRRARKAVEEPVVTQTHTRRNPGYSAADPISILSDDDEPSNSHPKDNEPGDSAGSKVQFTSRPSRVIWNVQNLTWGGKPYGFSVDYPAPMTVTLTDDFFEFKPHDATFPGLCVNLRDRTKKPFLDIACNTFHSPCFIAFRPAASSGITGLSSTDTRAHTDVDHRYFVLYFDKPDDGRASMVTKSMAKFSYRVESVMRELLPEELSRFDCIFPRPGRGRTRSATLKTLDDTTMITRRLNASKPILQYPIHASTGNRITLTEDDVEVLDPGNFLNDSIVDFYLLYLKDKSDCERFHIFNSFFYKKYTSAGAVPHAGVAECYKAVKNWTRNVDLFKKDFLIMPVCDKMHWSCVIACHPGLLMETLPVDSETAVFPCIILMDSLGSHSGPKLFRMFRNYLTSEWNERQPVTAGDVVECFRITPSNMPGIVVQVPQQTNDCDCGLFMLQYVEEFLLNPFSDFRKPHVHNPTWFEPESIVREKRDSLRRLLMQLSEQWNAARNPADGAVVIDQISSPGKAFGQDLQEEREAPPHPGSVVAVTDPPNDAVAVPSQIFSSGEALDTDSSEQWGTSQCPDDAVTMTDVLCSRDTLDHCSWYTLDECPRDTQDQCSRDTFNQCSPGTLDQCSRDTFDQCSRDTLDQLVKEETRNA